MFIKLPIHNNNNIIIMFVKLPISSNASEFYLFCSNYCIAGDFQGRKFLRLSLHDYYNRHNCKPNNKAHIYSLLYNATASTCTGS